MTTETTALTLPERASVALGSKDYELKLAELVKSSVRIVEIKNGDGYKEARGARMSLKNTRVAITNIGKAAREDATAFSKAIIAEERRLVALIEPEETRLQTLQDAWDAEREAERQAKLKAEQERIERHRAGIDAIKAVALQAVNQPSGEVSRLIGSLKPAYAGPDFEEFQPAAEKAKAETLAALCGLCDAALAREAEAARLKAERIERERQQTEEAERLAAERAKFAEEQRAAREKQAELDRQAAAARRLADEKAAAERAEADRKAAAERAEAEAIIRQASEAEERRLAAERAEAERIAEEARQAEAARIAAEKVRQDAAEAERRAAAEKTYSIRRFIDEHLDLMSDEQLTGVLQFVAELMNEPKREAA